MTRPIINVADGRCCGQIGDLKMRSIPVSLCVLAVSMSFAAVGATADATERAKPQFLNSPPK